jgi:beta-N-acetylhexosaminidase
MSDLKALIGPHFIIGIQGHSLTEDEKNFLVQNQIGGVILFARNIGEPKQIHALCSEIQSLAKLMANRMPLFIGIDMEGGRVHRLQAPFTKWPALAHLGVIDKPNASYQMALAMGLEMAAVGINLDFAPCADVLTNPQNPVIGDRSIGADPLLVEKHVSAMIRGYLKAGMIACVKHFPGHGNTMVDSHLELPIEKETNLESLERVELLPFRKAIKSGVEMVMSAHIHYPQIDPEWPGTLSRVIMTDLLWSKLQYRGLTVTDDMGMKAMTNFRRFPKSGSDSALAGLEPLSVGDGALRALLAGCDLLLYCNEPAAPVEAYEAVERALRDRALSPALSRELIQRGTENIFALKKQRLSQATPVSFDAASKIIGHPQHQLLADGIRNHNIPPHLLSRSF